VGAIKSLEPRRILEKGVLCRESETLAYFFVSMEKGIVSGKQMTNDQVTAAFAQSRREYRKYAERFKDNRLFRSPKKGEAMVGI